MIVEQLTAFSSWFEEFLNNTVKIENEEYTEHYDAMRYSLLQGGKRLRPFILKLCLWNGVCGARVRIPSCMSWLKSAACRMLLPISTAGSR